MKEALKGIGQGLGDFAGFLFSVLLVAALVVLATFVGHGIGGLLVSVPFVSDYLWADNPFMPSVVIPDVMAFLFAAGVIKQLLGGSNRG